MRTLAIDQGTSATKAIVVEDGVVLASASVEVGTHALPDGGVEQDPEEIWRSVVAAGRAALGEAGGSASAVGLANQGETVLAWIREDGRPLTPAISWQDRRSYEVTQRLAGEANRLREITGLPLDPYFAAPKMRWLRERVTDAGIVTTIDAWINQRLTGRLVTDATTASRTMLLDLDRLEWSADALLIFGSDGETLPDIVRCDEVVGGTDAFGPPMPLAGLAVDQQAALLADGCLTRGDTKCTFGTGAFMLVNAGIAAVRSDSGLAASLAWHLRDGSAYCLDGQVFTAGSALGWLRDIGVLAHEHDLDRLASAAPSAGEVIFVPGLAGLAAPFSRPDARGAFLGLSLSTSRAHLARAVVDGIAASVAGLVRVAEQDLALRLDRLVVDGGLTRSSTLMQAQADLAQVRIEVHPQAHATAVGVAALTLMAMGHADAADDLTTGWVPSAIFEPRISRDEAAATLDAWQRAVASVIEPPAVAT